MATFKNPILKCDKCGKDFKLKRSRIKTEEIGDVERTYFKCPSCKHKFIVMYKNEEIKENLKEMDNIKFKIQELLKHDKNVQNLMDKYKKLYYRNLEINEKYKSLYGR